MNKTGCSCGPKEKTPRSSPYENTGQRQDVAPGGTGNRGPGPVRRSPCGPQPCGREPYPIIPKPAPVANTRPKERQDDEGPKGFEMNDATWSLCASVMLFCCGVYLTKKIAIVASELG